MLDAVTNNIERIDFDRFKRERKSIVWKTRKYHAASREQCARKKSQIEQSNRTYEIENIRDEVALASINLINFSLFLAKISLVKTV